MPENIVIKQLADDMEDIVMLSDHGTEVAGFVLFMRDGAVDYRFPYPNHVVKEKMHEAAEAL